ncbi:MAG TPA: radical SAM protein [Myxococcota bacterium]|mgnify:CR=1 FL=1|nr:radical SAM protein [Myxococcota bacterium]HOA13277.1 radical SAM protein [Myxococcota bacterium]HOC99056.1 radical SAM protein [Myxococcota bacterium]HOH76875.1 radical SAM protein [Myxococcota bacterium]HPV03751.1 radical SAM protein [Myxococcota bacterium]
MQDTVVTIETGLGCNNRCAHCPQPAIRAAGPVTQPSFQEIRQKIDTARAQGFTQISFSGGEPTIRRDIAELVNYARTTGFQKVSITTNGRMFSYPKFADLMLKAGLTGVSVSLHGPTAEIHESLTMVPGSFEQALAGIRYLKERTSATGAEFDITTITVLVPGNIDLLRETLLLAQEHGATVHIVQPFILSKENLARGARFLLGIDRIVAGIRTALEGGLPNGRVKPYNIPPCLLSDIGPEIEVQSYHLRTVREFDPVDGTSAVGTVAGQFFRYSQCSQCDAICPGLRIEHVSQTAMVKMILADIMSSRPFVLPKSSSLSSTDLLEAPALDRLLGELARAGATSPVLFWGGIGLCPQEDFMEVCRRRNVSQVILVARPPQLRPPDARVSIPGNIAEIRELLKRFRTGQVPVPALFIVINSVYSEQCDFNRKELLDLVDALVEAGGRRLLLSAPEGMDPLLPAHTDELKDRVIADLPALLAELAERGIEPCLSRTVGVDLDGHDNLLEARVAEFIRPVNLNDDFLHHRFAAPENGWIMWSYPIWIHRSVRDVPVVDADLGV